MDNASAATDPVIAVAPLGFPWPTLDPFLFCVHHDDAYPRATDAMAPDAPIAGRAIGQDFSGKDGWSLYHGHPVPGFPGHPHRGFETVTIVRQGLIDHSDSLGATARFGAGDTQWLTAGKGIVHAEMFPLLDTAGPNPLELFQIWLNLPAKSKMAPPHFTMFWAADIPRLTVRDRDGRVTEIACIAGRVPAPAAAGEATSRADPLPPPPDSWAADPAADVAIWTLRMAPHARWTLPAAAGAATRRSLYFFRGTRLSVAGRDLSGASAVELRGDAEVELVNGDAPAELLLLQGRPIGEPVVQHGPFVMNSAAEIAATVAEFQRTGFGGWPWPDRAPVHGRDPARFARHGDGREERPARLESGAA